MLILPEWLIISPTTAPKHYWGARIVEDHVADVASNDDLRIRYPDEDIWDASGMVLAPGFVNAHMHTYGVLAHGIPVHKAPAGFWPFLTEFWWPRVEDALDHTMIQAATDLQCARMLRSGVTTFYDCLEAPHALPGCLQAQAEVVQQRGMRAILSFEATERVSTENGQLGLRENVAFMDTWGVSNGQTLQEKRSLVLGMMCFHTTFTCSEHFIRQAFALARARGAMVHAHVSEGTYEPQYNLEHHNMRTLSYYEHLGVLGSDFLASQCVQIAQEEIDIMAAHGVRMAHMPLSNCEVGGGIAPLPELTAEGITTGLGSDGYIDDFFEIMRGAFLIHKASHMDPQAMPAHTVWYLATEGGACALGLEKVGRIAAGWQADVQLIDAALPTPLTVHNLYDQLLLYRNAHHVRGVMVAGKVLLRGGELVDVDMDALTAYGHEAAQRLWAR